MMFTQQRTGEGETARLSTKSREWASPLRYAMRARMPFPQVRGGCAPARAREGEMPARRMAGPAARPRGRQSQFQALPDPTAFRTAAAQPGRDRGRLLPHAAPARQSAVPAVGHLPLDRRAPRVAGYGPVRRGQVVVILRARAEGLPQRLHRPLRARAAPVRRSRSRAW